MKNLEETLDKLNIEYTGKMMDQLSSYMDGILSWNEKVNLTAITNREDFITKHYIDSVVVMALEEFKKGERVIDIGTGAGFPGIPLAILNPEKDFVLADSLKKRLKIIDELVENIGILNVSTIHGRAEELGRRKEYRETFHLCLSRAVANLSTLSEYAIPFVRKNGYFLAYKGPVAEEELKEASKAITLLGGKTCRIEPAELDGYKHNIVVIEKIGKTPSKFPRKAGIPSKEPIK